ncbi:MAG: dihydroorotate dehydrogenase [Abditibacteriota bacterium]|nr:dihydroorotate dehydrogenase [Abditibacteriota bacterium]
MVTAVNLGGLMLKNPVTVGSGTFGYGMEMAEFYDISLLGGISVKGTSLTPRAGNPYPRTCETASGILNAIGLQNPGADRVLAEYLPRLEGCDTRVILNIIGNTADEYAALAEMFDGCSRVDAFELNVSCPNVKTGGIAFGTSAQGISSVVSAVRARTAKPVICKLSPNVTDITEMARAAEAAGSDAVSLVNTFLGTAIDPYKKRFVLANRTGGLSGPCIKPLALRMVNDVFRAVRIPVLGQGGIMTGTDAIEFMLAGATAVSVGTANLTKPDAALDVVRGIEEYMRETGVEDVNTLIGAAI